MSETGIKTVKNFMASNSYTANPLTTLKMVAASSIFGEPSYYIGNEKTRITNLVDFLANPNLLFFKELNINTTEEIMETAIDRALEHDFAATIEYAKELRNEFNMRLNPQIIFVRAAIHPKRVEFNTKHPGLMREVGKAIINRPDDMKNQLDYYISQNGSKHNLPGLIKRVWTDKLVGLSEYQTAKYKSKGLIDLARVANTRKVRIKNKAINTLMETGNFAVSEENQTWEKLKSEGKTWTEILNTIRLPHMALLRNLRNIEQEIKDVKTLENVAEWLVAGVERGRQFPFRYYTASQHVTSATFTNALHTCMTEAMKNFPVLKGKTMSLSDNSGSAWGALNSEYGQVTVAEIGNLSSVMTAINSDEGHVGVFGDKLIDVEMKGDEVLDGLKAVNRKGKNVGGSTETGIWLFWDKAIKNNEHWDNVFIYSDQQAGHGGLYGTNENEYKDFAVGGAYGGRYIDVMALVNKYRENVNPNVNVFSIQTAGYDNAVLPETAYRTAILSGWTGKETLYAKEMIDLWNSQY
jgi:hypothetical protein